MSVGWWKGGIKIEIRIKIQREGGGGVTVVGGGEAGVLEELVAGESCDRGIFGFGEFAEALDGHLGVGLGEELGLLEEEVCAELAVGGVLLGEEELLAVFVGEVGEGEGGVGILNDKF